MMQFRPQSITQTFLPPPPLAQGNGTDLRCFMTLTVTGSWFMRAGHRFPSGVRADNRSWERRVRWEGNEYDSDLKELIDFPVTACTFY
ncbi:hypothetical protein CDAR_501251 [Caerostris darwini]|uniref:Uncharacterized protein n=1 Tax=Caerostris darwini TaxID=1538125 RepID=A0AAV4R6M5_9ARAC|nr:hypothetical protein CDAR_501251 [Caerostris darwini]